MPKITHIEYKADRERYWIFVDGEYCTSIRERTFPALDLRVDQTISCEQIKELESHHWKHAYGQSAWDKEKIRLGKVKDLIESFDDRVLVEVVGFGADTNKFISGHPTESGKPDLEVKLRDGGRILLLVEVTGTEFMRGTTYWVRPDKLKYSENHSTEDVWLVLHFLKPIEKFVFIKPNPKKRYAVSKMEIRGSIELYVEFSDSDQEVVSMEHFRNHLVMKVNQ
ncbi:hypothetical protein Q9R35_08870 [Alcaligenes sp. AB3]|uniref:hypothetical protein n=1 Tax=Alcaligenes sp. AB3 TaxID=2962569 RepID=UPI00288189C5|nr:hypothetical protein [Alcaligenes sp. AB3]MDT0217429.1 hypothetical protein [Alcaligenes sp. AB3]